MIRQLKHSDLNRVVDIWLETNLQTHLFIDAQYWVDNVHAVRKSFDSAKIYVYEDEDEIYGFVGLDGNYIAGIFICAEAQSKGIGKQLLNFMKSRKKQLNLNVYQKNTRAIHFHIKEGFVIQCNRRDDDTGELEYGMIWTPHSND